MPRIVLGCGQYQRIEGYEHQDQLRFDNVQHTFNLNETDWPLKSDYYESVIATHVIEHLKDLKNFMNECHRIIKIGGTIYLETPIAGEDPDLEFADPTHVRCFRPHTFINYMTIEGEGKFKYGFKCWGNLHIEKKNSVMIIHATPIK